MNNDTPKGKPIYNARTVDELHAEFERIGDGLDEADILAQEAIEQERISQEIDSFEQDLDCRHMIQEGFLS